MLSVKIIVISEFGISNGSWSSGKQDDIKLKYSRFSNGHPVSIANLQVFALCPWKLLFGQWDTKIDVNFKKKYHCKAYNLRSIAFMCTHIVGV